MALTMSSSMENYIFTYFTSNFAPKTPIYFVKEKFDYHIKEYKKKEDKAAFKAAFVLFETTLS